jgi:uncharacterized protein YbbK (DUF523 family)
MTPVREIDRARVGISSCLLGDLVRFDGGHKRNTYCADVLSETVEWVPVCPEVEVGMGTPREAVRLVGDTDQLRMIGSETGHDWTDEMNQYARIRVQELVQLDLDGYVLKSRSPSCGMQSVAVDRGDRAPEGEAAGLFARELMAACPDLPMVEEDNLSDPERRESFMAQVISRRRRRRF